MSRIFVATLVLSAFVLTSNAFALYEVSESGQWPASWTRQLESLRKQSRTFVGPTLDAQHHAIRFQTRDEFEAPWPHILKVKNEAVPIFLVRGPNFFVGKEAVGVVVHSPVDRNSDKNPPAPVPGYPTESRSRWLWTGYIEMVVDGHIVDLNRIPLPTGTLIIDERFKGDKRTAGTMQQSPLP